VDLTLDVPTTLLDFGDIEVLSSKVTRFNYPTFVWRHLLEERLGYQCNLYIAGKYI